MKFNLELSATVGVTWPKLNISVNKTNVGCFVIDESTKIIEFECTDITDQNTLTLSFNKTQNETVISDNGDILQDQSLTLCRMWIDDVLMEPWMLTDGVYSPEYFQGFLNQHPDSPKEIKSQLSWHFPGKYVIRFLQPFWPWYSNIRRQYSKKINLDKDKERWENYSGSFESHQDLVNEIYTLINVKKNSNRNMP